jgi:hypothetical protein
MARQFVELWSGKMTCADRREMLKFALGVSLLPLLASQRVSAATPGTNSIRPPSGNMLYRRRLVRGLPGGANFIVTREFRVRFEPVATGFLLNGAQLSARVEAPEALASFAAIEEQRVETGMFPLALDAAGQIIEGNAELPANAIEHAMQDVRQRFPVETGKQPNEAVDFIEALHSSGTRLTAELPKDLFAPVEGLRSDHREIALPWGDKGEVTTWFEAERDPLTHLMRHARREVVTRMGDDTRRNFEGWDLLPV